MPGIFNTNSFSTKFLLNGARRADGTFVPGAGPDHVSGLSGKFVSANGANSLPGDYIRLSAGYGIWGHPGYRQGPQPTRKGIFGLGDEAAGSNRDELCSINCNAAFKGSGRAARCTSICRAAKPGSCAMVCDVGVPGAGGFSAGRRHKCTTACTDALNGRLSADAAAEGAADPNAPPPSGMSTPAILAIGAIAVGGILLLARKKKG